MKAKPLPSVTVSKEKVRNEVKPAKRKKKRGGGTKKAAPQELEGFVLKVFIKKPAEPIDESLEENSISVAPEIKPLSKNALKKLRRQTEAFEAKQKETQTNQEEVNLEPVVPLQKEESDPKLADQGFIPKKILTKPIPDTQSHQVEAGIETIGDKENISRAPSALPQSEVIQPKGAQEPAIAQPGFPSRFPKKFGKKRQLASKNEAAYYPQTFVHNGLGLVPIVSELFEIPEDTPGRHLEREALHGYARKALKDKYTAEQIAAESARREAEAQRTIAELKAQLAALQKAQESK